MCIKCGRDIFCYCGQNPEKTEERELPVNNIVRCADGCLLGWFWHEDESEPIWEDSRMAKELKTNDDAIWGFKFCPYCGNKISI